MSNPDRRRNLLHRKDLEDFRAFALAEGYVEHQPKPQAVWERLRLERFSPSGNNPHIVIHDRASGDHLTVSCRAGIRLVRAFIDYKKTSRVVIPFPKREDEP